MSYEMRELRGDDLFTLLSIVGKLDIKDDFVKIFEKNSEASTNSETDAEKRGMEAAANLLQTVLKNIGTVKDDINTLLADLCGVNTKEIKELGLKDYTTLLINFFKKPELKDFFTSIASLL